MQYRILENKISGTFRLQRKVFLFWWTDCFKIQTGQVSFFYVPKLGPKEFSSEGQAMQALEVAKQQDTKIVWQVVKEITVCPTLTKTG